MRVLRVSHRSGIQGIIREMAGAFTLPAGLEAGSVVTIASPIDFGYLDVEDASGRRFRVAMQEVFCGEFYEVEPDVWAPPSDPQVVGRVTTSREVHGHRFERFEASALHVQMLSNPPLRRHREIRRMQPPMSEIFDAWRKSGPAQKKH